MPPGLASTTRRSDPRPSTAVAAQTTLRPDGDARAAGTATPRRSWTSVLATAVLLFALASVPRAVNLDQHATADEDLTLIRSANVVLALERRDWWGTYQIGHPEATVQLLVALGLGADALRPYAGEFLGPDGRAAARVPGYFATLVEARRLLVPVHALLVVAAALLAWRLWEQTPGLLVGVLLALEPFLVAHGRILRTDALLAELMVVAVLAALAFWSGRAGWWALGLCAAASGLAFLTKTPSLALLAAIPATALAAILAGGDGRWWRVRLSPGRSSLAVVGALAAWLVGSAAVAVAVWPALWARPLRALERMAVYTQEKGGSPMDAGSFFLGAPIADPGPLYYALALPLRLSPVVLAGLLLWLLLRPPGARRGVGATLAIGLGLAAVLALLPKKADRYVLPAVPFLVVVAAAGLAALTERRRAFRAASVVGVALSVEMALLALAWPYPLAAYNPLLGGAEAAEEWISVGWGEGLDQLAPVLNTRQDAGALTVSTPYPEVLQAQIAGRAVDLDAYDVAEYAVRYVAATQRRLTAPALDAALARREPLARVEIAGVRYAELYQLDAPAFGDLQMRQVDVSPGLTTRRAWVTIRLALGPPPGQGPLPSPAPPPVVAPLEVEASLVNAVRADDVEASVTRAVVPDGSLAELRLRAPNGLGRYVVGVSVRDPGTGSRLAVTSWPVGAPRLPEAVVFPSRGVRVQ